MDTASSHRIPEVEAGVRPLSTVLKTLAVVELFAGQTRPMRLAEVAGALKLSRATAYQRLQTLVAGGLLEQDDSGHYRLSMFAVRLAAAALDQADLGTRSEPILARLVQEVQETASLSVLDRGLPCIVARVEAESLLRAEQKIGTFMSLEGSASGRVLVAFADEATLARLSDGPEPLPAAEVLEATRRDGFALSSGYTQSGVKGIAAPIFDLHGACRATLSLVVPEARFDLDAVRGPLTAAAADVTRILKGEQQIA